MPLEDADSLDRMLAAHERSTGRAARRIADAGTDRMERDTRRRTPIDTNPFRHDPERPRGTARASIHRQAGIDEQPRGSHTRYVGTVESFDVVVRYLEEDTPPHTIRPRTPGGFLRFQSRDGFVDRDGKYHPPGTWVSVREVRHPGTKGTHAFALAALDAEVDVDRIAGPELERWRREVESGRF